jgi:hypothetical protein
MGAVTFGLPSVLLPMGADQPHNAARCADLEALPSADHAVDLLERLVAEQPN